MNMEKHACEAVCLVLRKQANAYAKAALIGAPVGASLATLIPAANGSLAEHMSKKQKALAGASLGALGGIGIMGIARNGGVIAL